MAINTTLNHLDILCYHEKSFFVSIKKDDDNWNWHLFNLIDNGIRKKGTAALKGAWMDRGGSLGMYQGREYDDYE